MRHRLLLLLSCLSLAACSRPSQTEMFIRADKADGGVYSFPVEMTDSLADSETEDRRKEMTAAFVKSTRYELMFWNQAYTDENETL